MTDPLTQANGLEEADLTRWHDDNFTHRFGNRNPRRTARKLFDL